MSETERGTEQLLREMERARARQLDIARSWILLFTLAATVGFWWVFYDQLKLDFYLSWLLGIAAAFVVSRILSFFVGMQLGKRYARRLKNQLLERPTNDPDQVAVPSSGGAGTVARFVAGTVVALLTLWGLGSFYYAITSHPFSGDQAAVGAAFIVAAIVIYKFAFSGRKILP